MKKRKPFANVYAILLGGLILSMLAGCVGYVDTGYAGPGYIGPWGPDVVVFGGYGRGHWDRDAGRRGAVSRGYIGHR